MSDLFLDDEAVLMRLEFVIDHLVYLFLEERSLLLIEGGVFFEGGAECVLGYFEVVLDHYEGVLQNVLKYLHFLLDVEQMFLGLCVGRTRC